MRQANLRFKLLCVMVATIFVVAAIVPFVKSRYQRRQSELANYRMALASQANARQNRINAEAAIAAYEASHANHLQAISREIELAEADFRRAEERFQWVEQILRNGQLLFVNELHERVSVEKARLRLERTRTNKLELEVFGRLAKRRPLDAQLARAKAEEAAGQAHCDQLKAGLNTSWLFR